VIQDNTPRRVAQGWLVVIHNPGAFAARHKREFNTALKVLTETAHHWRTQSKPFWILLLSEPPWLGKLPELKVDPTK
jgi:hypothetical protein